uniref:Pdc2 n=1 Tax=Arundo donax TaxID=35708 RepID=A0A0A9G3K9_ARUDO
MQITGRFSLKAPATALMALSPPTVKVTAQAPTPPARARA